MRDDMIVHLMRKGKSLTSGQRWRKPFPGKVTNGRSIHSVSWRQSI